MCPTAAWCMGQLLSGWRSRFSTAQFWLHSSSQQRARRQYAGGRRGGSITKSARPKEQLALLSCCRVLLLRKLSVLYTYPAKLSNSLPQLWYMRARDSTRVEASAREPRALAGVRPPGPLEHRARSGASSSSRATVRNWAGAVHALAECCPQSWEGGFRSSLNIAFNVSATQILCIL